MDHDDVRWLDAEEQHAWRNFISAITLLTRRLGANLLEHHDVSMDDYALLVLLSEAPGRRVRMSRLADHGLIPRPQVTYRVNRLEQRGIVERVPCAEDARGVEARLTDEGMALLERAARDHVTAVREQFLDHLTREEFLELGRIMGRVHAGLAGEDVEGAFRA